MEELIIEITFDQYKILEKFFKKNLYLCGLNSSISKNSSKNISCSAIFKNFSIDSAFFAEKEKGKDTCKEVCKEEVKQLETAIHSLNNSIHMLQEENKRVIKENNELKNKIQIQSISISEKEDLKRKYKCTYDLFRSICVMFSLNPNTVTTAEIHQYISELFVFVRNLKYIQNSKIFSKGEEK